MYLSCHYLWSFPFRFTKSLQLCIRDIIMSSANVQYFTRECINDLPCRINVSFLSLIKHHHKVLIMWLELKLTDYSHVFTKLSYFGFANLITITRLMNSYCYKIWPNLRSLSNLLFLPFFFPMSDTSIFPLLMLHCLSRSEHHIYVYHNVWMKRL